MQNHILSMVAQKTKGIMPTNISLRILRVLYHILTAVLNFVLMRPGAMQLTRILSGASS